MAGQTTLIVTTRTGVRPLGVRGEPLHNTAPASCAASSAAGWALLPAHLLADPQPHDDGTAIDWYADWPGEVPGGSTTSGTGQSAERVLDTVDRGLRDISRSRRHAGRRPSIRENTRAWSASR